MADCNNSTIIQSNSKLSANNCEIKGNGNTITGNNNDVFGNDNRIFGNNNSVKGTGNTIMGNNCDARGDYNSLTGSNCAAKGENNTVTGNNGSNKSLRKIPYVSQSERYSEYTKKAKDTLFEINEQVKETNKAKSNRWNTGLIKLNDAGHKELEEFMKQYKDED